MATALSGTSQSRPLRLVDSLYHQKSNCFLNPVGWGERGERAKGSFISAEMEVQKGQGLALIPLTDLPGPERQPLEGPGVGAKPGCSGPVDGSRPSWPGRFSEEGCQPTASVI